MPKLLGRILGAWRRTTHQSRRESQPSADDGDDSATTNASASDDIGVTVRVTEVRRPAAAADKLLKRITSFRLTRPSHWLARAQNNGDAVRSSSSSSFTNSKSRSTSSSRSDNTSNVELKSRRSRSAEPKSETGGNEKDAPTTKHLQSSESPGRPRRSHRRRSRLRGFLCWPRAASKTARDQNFDDKKELSTADIECLYRPPDSKPPTKQSTPMPAVTAASDAAVRHSLSKAVKTDKDSSSTLSSSLTKWPAVSNDRPATPPDQIGASPSRRGGKEATEARSKPEFEQEPEVNQEPAIEPNLEQEPEVKATLAHELEIYADLEQESEINSETHQKLEAIKQMELKHNNSTLVPELAPETVPRAKSELTSQAFSDANGDTWRERAPAELVVDDLSLADEAEYQRLFNRRARTLIGSSASAEDCPTVFADLRATVTEAPDARSMASTEGEEQSPGSASCLIATLTRMTESHPMHLVHLGSASIEEPEDCATG